MGNYDPGQGWTTDEQGNRVLDLGSDVLHGNGLLKGILPNYYNQAPIIDATNTNQEQGPTFFQGLFELGRDAIGQAKDSYDWAKNNPGALASTALSVMPEVGIPAKIASGILGAAYDQYGQNLTPTEKGLGLAMGAFGAIPGGEEAGAAERGFKPFPGVPKAFEPFPGVPHKFEPFPSPYIAGPKPLTIPSEDIGAIPGYQVPNYDAIPGAEDLRKRMIIDEGMTQYMPATDAGNPWLGDQMVGNPEWMTDPRTPEGQNFRAAMSQRNPQLPLKVYSGLRSGAPFDPEAVGITSVDRPIDAEFGYRLNENGLYEIPKWTSDKPLIANTYAYPPKQLDDDELRDMVLDKIKSGVINENNYPKKLYSSISEMKDALEDPNQYSRHMANTILSYTRDLDYIPRVQEFIPFASNPRLIDKQGKGWATALPSEAEYDVRRPLMSAQGGRPYQAGQIYNAMQAGNDALVYQNQIDAGMALANRSKPVEQSLAMSTPSDVLVALNHSKLKYPYNMGMWDLKDIRPLAAVPLGLGAGLGAYMYNKGEANGNRSDTKN